MRSLSSRRFSLSVEVLEPRIVLAAFPAFVNGVFSMGNPAGGVAPYGLENTFLLSSNPTATKTIYLDFDGHHSVNDGWGHNIVFPPFNTQGSSATFTNGELIEIQQHFQNVAEDFLPFDINVTTQDPGVEALRRTSSNDIHYGVRVVATQATGGFGNGIGGVAFLNSFPSAQDTPVFTFNKGARNGGMTSSHEVGHALGLSHDGLGSQAYHPGTGSGATSWGPIMGAPFGRNLTQWSKGDYAGATTTQDDLNIITKPANGFGFRVDDYGGTLATANALTGPNGVVSRWGIVERNTDVDFFVFKMSSGNVTLNLAPFAQDPNLDILAKLYDQNGSVIAESNPLDAVTASFNINLLRGLYYLSVEGTGRPDRYSDYGSLGFYTVTGNIPPAPTGGLSTVGSDFELDLSFNSEDGFLPYTTWTGFVGEDDLRSSIASQDMVSLWPLGHAEMGDLDHDHDHDHDGDFEWLSLARPIGVQSSSILTGTADYRELAIGALIDSATSAQRADRSIRGAELPSYRVSTQDIRTVSRNDVADVARYQREQSLDAVFADFG